VICSALVAGIIPVALGLAWAAKRQSHREQVYCFIGDMAATSGLAHECTQYAKGHDLPLHIIIEDNGLSVFTNTMAVWGLDRPDKPAGAASRVTRYPYRLTQDHVGTGKWVAM
jgi:transketolase